MSRLLDELRTAVQRPRARIQSMAEYGHCNRLLRGFQVRMKADTMPFSATGEAAMRNNGDARVWTRREFGQLAIGSLAATIGSARLLAIDSTIGGVKGGGISYYI